MLSCSIFKVGYTAVGGGSGDSQRMMMSPDRYAASQQQYQAKQQVSSGSAHMYAGSAPVQGGHSVQRLLASGAAASNSLSHNLSTSPHNYQVSGIVVYYRCFQS